MARPPECLFWGEREIYREYPLILIMGRKRRAEGGQLPLPFLNGEKTQFHFQKPASVPEPPKMKAPEARVQTPRAPILAVPPTITSASILRTGEGHRQYLARLIRITTLLDRLQAARRVQKKSPSFSRGAQRTTLNRAVDEALAVRKELEALGVPRVKYENAIRPRTAPSKKLEHKMDVAIRAFTKKNPTHSEWIQTWERSASREVKEKTSEEERNLRIKARILTHVRMVQHAQLEAKKSK